MKYLIVGLGNIGPEYMFSRHNAGFMALDRLAANNNLKFELNKLAYIADFTYKGKKVYLIKPTTFMNLSGKALNYYKNQLQIPLENILVIVDDLALPVGCLRLKPKGSSAGHNGLKNIEETLGNNEYARLKIGIGSDFAKGRQIDYVLGKFSEDEMIQLIHKFDKVQEMILSFCSAGIGPTMNFMNE